MPALATTASRRLFLQTGAAGMATTALAACGVVPNGKASAQAQAGTDATVWRVYGDELVTGAPQGRLTGMRVAVKDLFAVQGQVAGAGNGAWLAEQATPAKRSAPAVQRLLDAGATVVGMARTDEFAYSLAGTNGHYGTPPNPAAPDRISGGSSSGSAAAVALGQADIGLGTDTGGSIRIPSSYQGLWGMRPTHGVVSVQGLLPLAPSFDTVGWMARDANTLQRAGDALLPRAEAEPLQRMVLAPALFALADAPLAALLRQALAGWQAPLPALQEIAWDTGVLPDWVKAFQMRQGVEAWRAHGPWISANWATLNPDVKSRFQAASRYTAQDLASADSVLAQARTRINAMLGEAVLVLPSASSFAPLRTDAAMGGAVVEAARASTFQLTCLAGITGRCAISVPVATQGQPPAGLCLVGPRGRDRDLLRLANSLVLQGVAVG